MTPLAWRPAWAWAGRWPLALAGALVLAFAGLRALGTLGPTPLRWALPLGFTVMAALPWLMLTATGRHAIGLRGGCSAATLGRAAMWGALAAVACGVLGLALYGHGEGNWYQTIARSYTQTAPTAGLSLWAVVLIFTLPACLFSPIGEEIFFRGFLQRLLEQRWSVGRSTAVECSLFGVIHLCHHGLSWTAEGPQWLGASALIWMALMTATAALFAALRRASGSLLPAIVAHASFNAAMNGFIFTLLWPV